MAEGFELVRTIRQHLRRGAALLDEGKVEAALAEVDAALALDAQSLPAQALRDRIRAATSTGRAPVDDAAGTPSASSRSFVPHGVNAASWRGFEQRITERRFRALLERINTSIVAGNAATARAALEEARELRPGAAELSGFEARVAAMPIAPPVPETVAGTRVWKRAASAAALFLVGVSLLLGLEWLRPREAGMPATAAALVPAAPTAMPAAEPQRVDTSEPAPVPVALGDEESVPAVLSPPEPLLRPRATTGTAPIETTVAARPVVRREAPSVEHAMERQPIAENAPLVPVGEIPDDYVASRRSVGPSTDAARPGMGPRISESTPSPDARARTAAPAAVAVPAIAKGPADQMRVEEVLRRYARAYGDLDASAARAVWPTVNEKALARAFQNLASQNVSFDDCDIDIRGSVANASCRGQASFVGKVGNREPRTESMGWRFELRREGDAWKIENAEMRRRQTTAESRDQ